MMLFLVVHLFVNKKIIRTFADMKKIPQIVKDAARDLIEMYGDAIDYLGKYEGADFYMFKFPEDAETGFPFVYQCENGEVLEITGFHALDVVNLFVK